MPASLDLLFCPRSIAVIGASADPRNLGHRIVQNLVNYGFAGTVYPVNPHGGKIGDLPIYSSLQLLPQRASLVLVCVPRRAAADVVDQCARSGARAIVVVSAGFAETDAEGEQLQELLVARARDQGARLIGPNCVGVINTDPAVRLNTTFCPTMPNIGAVSLCSQSGAFGVLALAAGERFGVGFSQFISVGNEADVSAADLLEYWGADGKTAVILLYLESVTGGVRFREVAAGVGRSKPIVAIKAGREAAGQRAARSHTAALASSSAAVDALYRQTGMVPASGLDELLDLAALFTHQPLPQGRRVGIITNAGGPAVLCADACAKAGLELPAFSQELRRQLSTFLVPPASVANPVDMLASAGPAEYRRAIEVMLTSNEVDAVIVIYVPVEMVPDPAFVQAIGAGVAAARSSRPTGGPIVACVMSKQGERIRLATPAETIPCQVTPDAAGRSLGKAAAYAQWRREPRGAFPEFGDMDLDRARTIVAAAGDGWLSADQLGGLQAALNLPVVTSLVATTSREAVEGARRLGFPVALKTASSMILHKSDVGAVCLDLGSEQEVQAAFQRILQRATTRADAAAREGVLVQPMCSGLELMVGATRDPHLGPLVTFGLGGIRAELTHDVCHRLAPLTDRETRHMIRSIRGYPLLAGYRGQPPADEPAVQRLLSRVSRLIVELPQVQELDFNPVMALPPGEGCWIVDVRIRVQSSETRRPRGA